MGGLVAELTEKTVALHSSKARVGAPRLRSVPIIIAKVHDLTRNVDINKYDPDYIAIGPYNYPRPESDQRHLAMEHDKLICLDAVLSAARPDATLEVYVNELARLEQDARSCYGHAFLDMTSEQFVRMLLLDGCYILYRLTSLPPPRLTAPETAADVGISSANTAEALAMVRDVIYLAENQVPFFILDKIGQLTSMDGEHSVITQMKKYALNLMMRQRYVAAAAEDVGSTVPGNLLHLLHMHLKPAAILLPGGATATDSVIARRWRSATEYHLAGVEFKARAVSEGPGVRCILDVKLDRHGGTLEIPCLNIDGETWRMLRNLVGLEHRNWETVGSHVTAYCVFISQLACTRRDVELLVKRDAIVHGHGNDQEVADCFVDLCKGIQFDPNDANRNYLRETWKKMEKLYRNNPRGWMVGLRRNPSWITIGPVAAGILLVCEILQAILAVLSYQRSRN